MGITVAMNTGGGPCPWVRRDVGIAVESQTLPSVSPDSIPSSATYQPADLGSDSKLFQPLFSLV